MHLVHLHQECLVLLIWEIYHQVFYGGGTSILLNNYMKT